jgi:hypothetical protein
MNSGVPAQRCGGACAGAAAARHPEGGGVWVGRRLQGMGDRCLVAIPSRERSRSGKDDLRCGEIQRFKSDRRCSQNGVC